MWLNRLFIPRYSQEHRDCTIEILLGQFKSCTHNKGLSSMFTSIQNNCFKVQPQKKINIKVINQSPEESFMKKN